MISFALALILQSPQTKTAIPPLKVRVDGEGYLRFSMAGKLVFAKAATLTVKNGYLNTPDWATLWPKVAVPVGTQQLFVSIDGTVTAKSGENVKQVGQIVLATFPADSGLSSVGKYLTTAQKGSLSSPGEGLAGVIRADSEGGEIPPTELPSEKRQVATVTTSAGHQFATSNLKNRVRIRPHSEIESEQITLGDIADIEGDPAFVEKVKQIELGRTPLIGATRGISLIQVKAGILSKGIGAKTLDIEVPATADVIRKFQILEETQLVKAAQDAVQDQLRLPFPIVLQKSLSPMKVATGEVKIEVQKCIRSSNAIECPVTIRINGAKFAETSINFIPDPNALQVKPGEPILIRMISKGAAVDVSGKVRVGGYSGQKITVESEYKTMHTGVLLSTGVVEIRL